MSIQELIDLKIFDSIRVIENQNVPAKPINIKVDYMPSD